jgi:hypothetical protein
MVAALKKAGGKPIYTEYAGVGHGSWGPAYAEEKLWEWLFAQKIKKGGTSELRNLLQAMQGSWTLQATGIEQGKTFKDIGVVTAHWDTKKSKLQMVSEIKRGERSFMLIDKLIIDGKNIVMDRGDHQLTGDWNPSKKIINWYAKKETVEFSGRSIFSNPNKIEEIFTINVGDKTVFSVKATLVRSKK